MNKVKQFLMNRAENFKQASSFGKVWRTAGYGVLALVLLGILLPAPSEEQTEPVAQEPVAQENPTSEEWRQDQVEAAQEEAASKVTPKQEIRQALKDSLGDQYRASDVTKKPGGHHVFVKFDTDDAAHKLTIMQDARTSYESIDQPVVDFAFNAYAPTMDGEEALSMKAEKAAEFDQVVEQEDAWDITFIHPDLQ